MKQKIIISMTTIPQRIERLKTNIQSILNQSQKFDKLIINIDDNLSKNDYEFYKYLKTIDKRIIINKCEHKWRSCNKLLPTLKKYPNDIIITVDDDVYYPEHCFKYLIEQYNKTPDCIIAHEINPLLINKDFNYIDFINEYDIKLMQKEWGKYLSNCCLFPPHVFDNTDLYDYDKMMKCTNGTHDELWFWVNSTLNGVMCVGLNYVFSFAPEIIKPYEEDEYALNKINSVQETINGYMKNINEMYGDRLIEQIKNKKIHFTIDKDNIYSFFFLLPYIKIVYWYGYDINCQTLTNAWTDKLHKAVYTNEPPKI